MAIKNRKFKRTFWMTVLIGPPIGACTVFGVLVIQSILSGDFQKAFASTNLPSAIVFLLIAIPASYLKGALYAALVGLGFGLYGNRRGALPFWLSISLGALTAAIATAFSFGATMLSEYGGVVRFMPFLLSTFPNWFVTLLVHIASSVLCWLVVRKYWNMEQAS